MTMGCSTEGGGGGGGGQHAHRRGEHCNTEMGLRKRQREVWVVRKGGKGKGEFIACFTIIYAPNVEGLTNDWFILSHKQRAKIQNI